MMMFSTCPKCEGHSFRTQEVEALGAAYKLIFIQCASCNAPVGVTDFYNTGSLLKKQEKQLAALDSRLSQIEASLQAIAYALQQVARR